VKISCSTISLSKVTSI